MEKENLQKLQIAAKYLAFFAVGIGLFLLSYSFFSNTGYKGYDRYLVDAISNIQEVNDKCKDFTTANSIDKNKALKKLTDINSDLNAIKNDLVDNPPTEDNINYNSLLKGLDSNILILQQIEAMLNNPTGKDIEKAATDLQSYEDTTNNYYSLLSLKKLNFSIGKQLSLTINNVINYCLTSSNLRKEAEIKVDQYSDFIKKLDELNSLFTNNKVDYYPEVLKARKNGISYELIISSIDKTIIIGENIKTSLSDMIVPNDASPIYNQFKATIDNYNDYLKNIKYSIATESVHNNKKDAKEDFLDSLHVTSKKLYSEVEVKHKSFQKEYDKFKKGKLN
jgi:hypothetical protein